MSQKRQKTLAKYFNSSKPQQPAVAVKSSKIEENKHQEVLKKREIKSAVKEQEDSDEPVQLPPSGEEIFKDRFSTSTETIEKYSYAFCCLMGEYWKQRNCKVVIKSKKEKMALFNRISETCKLAPPTFIPGWAVIVVRTLKKTFKYDSVVASVLWTPERVQVISLSHGAQAFDRMKLFLLVGWMFSNIIGADFLFQSPTDFNINGVKRLNIMAGEWDSLPMIGKEKGLAFIHSNDFSNLDSPSTERTISFLKKFTGDQIIGNHMKWATDSIIKIAGLNTDSIGVATQIEKYINKVRNRTNLISFLSFTKPKRVVIVYPGEVPYRYGRNHYYESDMDSEEQQNGDLD